MLLFGTVDPLSPPAVIERAAAHAGPSAAIRIVRGAAHTLHFDAPADVYDQLHRLLNG